LRCTFFCFSRQAWRCATPFDLCKTGASGSRLVARLRRCAARLEKQQLAYFSFVHAIAHGSYIAAE
jgi:hypothetical protein